MMPESHRVGPRTIPPAAARKARHPRAANSSTLAIVVATSFALVSALVSLAPDAGRSPTAPDDLAQARLRGSLPAIADTTP